MSDKIIANLEQALREPLQQVLSSMTIEELREIDWFSYNADFYIAEKRRKLAA